MQSKELRSVKVGGILQKISERLRWAGHIVRMRESGPAKKSTFDLLLSERTAGRPKRRWIEEVERELKGMGVKDWKRLAFERDKWNKNVEEAKV
jgi:hypothetical protein